MIAVQYGQILSISQIEEPWMFWQHQHDSSEPRVNNYRLPPVQVCPPVTSTLWTRWSQTNCQQPLWPPKIILTKKLDAWFQFRAAAECFEVERDKADKWRRRNTLCMSRTTFGKSFSSSVNSHPFKVFVNLFGIILKVLKENFWRFWWICVLYFILVKHSLNCTSWC